MDIPLQSAGIPQTLEEINQLADIFFRSGYFKDIENVSQACVKILAGRELGIRPFAAMRGIDIIEGKPTLGTGLLASLIKRSGRYSYRVKSLTNEGCVLEFSENGQPVGESSFTRQDAEQADLIKRWNKKEGKIVESANYKRYPRNMFFARALSNGQTFYCPDVADGPVYTPDEMGIAVDVSGAALKSTDGTLIEDGSQPVQSLPAPSQQSDAPLSPQSKEFLADCEAYTAAKIDESEAIAAARARWDTLKTQYGFKAAALKTGLGKEPKIATSKELNDTMDSLENVEQRNRAIKRIKDLLLVLDLPNDTLIAIRQKLNIETNNMKQMFLTDLEAFASELETYKEIPK